MIPLANSNARVLEPVSDLDYFDTQSADVGRVLGPLQVWNVIMADAQPVMALAFKLRDAVSAPFGVKRIKGFSGQPVETASVGAYLDFFLVEHIDPHTLVLTERDSHLDVMTCISTDGPLVSITSSVKVHNLFGRLYMLPVGVAHKWIVRRMLKRLQLKVSA